MSYSKSVALKLKLCLSVSVSFRFSISLNKCGIFNRVTENKSWGQLARISNMKVGLPIWTNYNPWNPTVLDHYLYDCEKIDFFNDCDDLIRKKDRAITTICSRYDLANITGKLMVFTRINKISQICIDLYGIEDERDRGWLNNPYYKKFDLYQGCRSSPAYSCRGYPPECCRPCRSSGRSDCCGRTFSTVGVDGSRVMKRMR